MKLHPDHYPVEILHQLQYRPKDRARIFCDINVAERQMIWLRLSVAVQKSLAKALSDHDVVALMEAVDPDQAANLLRFLQARRRARILALASERLQESLQMLLRFDPTTAAGIMNLDYIQVEDTETIAIVAKHFKNHEQRTGRPPVILVVCAGMLRGYLPGYELGLRTSREKIKKHIRPIPTIHAAAQHREVIQLFRNNPRGKVVVMNGDGQVLGIIYSDDALRLMHEKESASLLSFAGVKDEETVNDPVAVKVRHRYKWLVVNLATCFMAAFTVGLFEQTIASFVLLAVYMPIVAGMGGNAATQTLAVMVRGIALGQITLRSASATMWREIGAGLTNGIINGVIVGLVVFALHQDFALALVLSFAMVINLVVAGFFGTVTPLIMQRLGKDPAASATVFITTATDVIGFLVFLSLATALLK